ncbi:hypothetical protein BGZ65_007385, partial [Modicella reniformis]
MVHALESLQEFTDLIASGKKVLIDYTATWCGPCKFISPLFVKHSEEHPDIVFVKVDVDAVPEISQEVGIRAMPTFHAYHNKEKVDEVVGADTTKLQQLINNLAAM